MSTLYLLRHGQTEFNVQKRVQGHSDSPLTPLGVEQAHAAARWLIGQGARFTRMCSSPLGRAMGTLEIVRDDMAAAGMDPLPPLEAVDGLIERSYGSFEAGPAAEVPCELWDPGEALIPYGGEGSRALRERMVSTMTQIMLDAGPGACVLAVSHGSASLQFKLAWQSLATCPQDVALGNCCILRYDFQPASRAFVNTAIVNQDV